MTKPLLPLLILLSCCGSKSQPPSSPVTGMEFGLQRPGMKIVPEEETEDNRSHFILEERLSRIPSADSAAAAGRFIDTLLFGDYRAADSIPLFIDPAAQWQLLYYRDHGWTEYFGDRGVHNHRYTYAGNDSAASISGAELVSTFRMNSYTHDTTWIQGYPFIYERNNIYNGIFMPVNRKGHLLIKFTHCYPDGNATSWYHETVYVFKKISTP